MRLSGALPRIDGASHWQLRVLYHNHSPIALLTGVLDAGKLVLGGDMGLRYIIKGNQSVEHGSLDGPLPSDTLRSLPVSTTQLQPRERP